MSCPEPRRPVRDLHANPWLLCGFHGLEMTLFPMAVITLFWRYQAGLGMTQILVLQAAFSLTMAIAEFPSGYIADRIGYRRILIVGSVCMAAGWGIYCVSSSFAALLVAEMIQGLACSLISGCDSALLYESLVATDREHRYSRWEGRLRFFGQSCEGLAALAAGVLFLWWMRLPFVLQVAIWLLNAGVAASLVEPARHRTAPANHVEQARAMLRYVLQGNRRLTAIVLLTVVFGLASFIPVWLIQLYATGAGVDPAWLGPIWSIANLSVAFGALASDRLGRMLGLMPTLLGCVLLVAMGYLGLGMSHACFGFAFYYCLTVMRGLVGPLLLHQEQRLIPSSDRAGFLSLRSLMFRISFVVLAPLIGIAIDAHGQHPVLLCLGTVLTGLALLGWFWLRAARPST